MIAGEQQHKNNLIYQDASKLHAEINQAVNHRFLLTAGAITAFALISKNIVQVQGPENIKIDDCVMNIDNYVMNIVSYYGYLSVLALLFFQSLGIRVIIRTNSTYLRIKEYSDWEKDWSGFRKKTKKFKGVLSKADLIAHGSIFVGLSVFSLVLGTYLMYKLCLATIFTENVYVFTLVPKILFGVGLIYAALSFIFKKHISSVFAVFSLCFVANGISFIKANMNIDPSIDSSIIIVMFIGLYLNMWLIFWFVLRIFTPSYDEEELLNIWRSILKPYSVSKPK